MSAYAKMLLRGLRLSSPDNPCRVDLDKLNFDLAATIIAGKYFF